MKVIPHKEQAKYQPSICIKEKHTKILFMMCAQ